MAYNGDKCLDVRKDAYGKKRDETKEDRREAARPGVGQYERKPGDRIYDLSLSPEAFTIGSPTVVPPGLGVRPASE